MVVLSADESAHCVPAGTMESEEDTGSPEAGVTGGC